MTITLGQVRTALEQYLFDGGDKYSLMSWLRETLAMLECCRC